jgi:hypothetical protein
MYVDKMSVNEMSVYTNMPVDEVSVGEVSIVKMSV